MPSFKVFAMELADVRRLGLALIAEHGLVGWRLELDRARRRAGICRYEQKVIGLSAPLMRLYDEAEVRETVLHEIAHALAGPRAQHGPKWRAIAHRIGSTGERCVSEEAPRVAGAWVGTCAYGHSVDLHRSPQRVRSCVQCEPRGFSPDHILEWRFRGQIAPMHPAYTAELARIRAVATGPARVDVGAAIRITARGRFHGTVGTVVKRGRTRYHVRIRGGLITVPFAFVEATERATAPT